MSFWDVFWPMAWFALYASYLTVLFHIVRDLFADPDSSGWSKALWVLLLLLVPVLAALAYLIAHGRTMALRTSARAEAAGRETDEHVRRTAAASPRRADFPGQGHAGGRHPDPGRIRHPQGADAQ
jgi:hypothetical protein